MPDAPESLRGLSPQELKFASWWVQHQLEVRRLGFGILLFFNALFWGYALWSVADAYAISFARERLIPRRIALNQQRLAELETDRPQDLAIEDVGSIPLSEGKVDLYAVLQNPNAQWWAEVTYRFDVSGEPTPLKSSYVLPGSAQTVLELGFAPGSAGGRNGTLSVEQVRWHRMDPRFAGADFAAFAAPRADFVVDNVDYDTSLLVGDRRVGQTTFDIHNRSAYGYWNMDAVVRLIRGASVVGITQVNLRELSPGEKRRVQVVWPEPPVGVSRTEVAPQVNVLDPSVYMKTEYFK
jgi:hypothetical protein